MKFNKFLGDGTPKVSQTKKKNKHNRLRLRFSELEKMCYKKVLPKSTKNCSKTSRNVGFLKELEIKV